MTFDAHQLDTFVLIGAAVTLAAILAVRFSSRTGLPTLLIYLFMGMVLGESGLGIQFEDVDAAQALGFAALALILAEGGLTTSWREFRPVMRLGATLALVGVGVTIGVVALAGHYLLDLSWSLAVLLGAVTAPTDAAAVFSVLRVVPLPRRLTGALEAESGLNDAPTVVLVGLISTGAVHEHSALVVAAIIGYELVVGTALGVGIGYAGSWLMRRAALPSSGLYPLAVLCLTFLAYGLAVLVHGSGFAAVYVAALILGNMELPHRGATRSFAEGLAWLAQIGLFVMLGLLASPGRITGETVGLALAAGLVLTLVARPLSVLLSSLFEGLSWRERAFMSWAGLRGAVPVVLMTIPLAEGMPGAERLFDIVLVMVVVYTLITAPSLPFAARLLGVARPTDPRALDLEVAPLERLAADLLQISITPDSRMHGVEVGELRLPHGASVSLVVRAGEAVVPERRTALRAGDEVLIVTPRALREATERRLRQVSRHGRLARWVREDRPLS